MKRVRWRKRLLAAMCAMMCLLGLSVQAFASIRNVSYADAAAELKRYFPLLEGTTDTCVLNVSFENSSVANLEEAKEAWKMVMGEWLNDPEYTVLFAMQTSPVTYMPAKLLTFRDGQVLARAVVLILVVIFTSFLFIPPEIRGEFFH